MEIKSAINFLDEQIQDPKKGLPDDIFYFISRTTPLVNVDLLIKDKDGRTLLAWRDDKYNGKGWHIPGGIIRFKETMEERLRKVASSEIGAEVSFNPKPLTFKQIIVEKQKNRSHFISFLFDCSIDAKFKPDNKGLTDTSNGFLKFHDKCPDNLLKCHEVYREYLN